MKRFSNQVGASCRASSKVQLSTNKLFIEKGSTWKSINHRNFQSSLLPRGNYIKLEYKQRERYDKIFEQDEEAKEALEKVTLQLHTLPLQERLEAAERELKVLDKGLGVYREYLSRGKILIEEYQRIGYICTLYLNALCDLNLLEDAYTFMKNIKEKIPEVRFPMSSINKPIEKALELKRFDYAYKFLYDLLPTKYMVGRKINEILIPYFVYQSDFKSIVQLLEREELTCGFKSRGETSRLLKVFIESDHKYFGYMVFWKVLKGIKWSPFVQKEVFDRANAFENPLQVEPSEKSDFKDQKYEEMMQFKKEHLSELEKVKEYYMGQPYESITVFMFSIIIDDVLKSDSEYKYVVANEILTTMTGAYSMTPNSFFLSSFAISYMKSGLYEKMINSINYFRVEFGVKPDITLVFSIASKLFKNEFALKDRSFVLDYFNSELYRLLSGSKALNKQFIINKQSSNSMQDESTSVFNSEYSTKDIAHMVVSDLLPEHITSLLVALAVSHQDYREEVLEIYKSWNSTKSKFVSDSQTMFLLGHVLNSIGHNDLELGWVVVCDMIKMFGMDAYRYVFTFYQLLCYKGRRSMVLELLKILESNDSFVTDTPFYDELCSLYARHKYSYDSYMKMLDKIKRKNIESSVNMDLCTAKILFENEKYEEGLNYIEKASRNNFKSASSRSINLPLSALFSNNQPNIIIDIIEKFDVPCTSLTLRLLISSFCSNDVTRDSEEQEAILEKVLKRTPSSQIDDSVYSTLVHYYSFNAKVTQAQKYFSMMDYRRDPKAYVITVGKLLSFYNEDNEIRNDILHKIRTNSVEITGEIIYNILKSKISTLPDEEISIPLLCDILKENFSEENVSALNIIKCLSFWSVKKQNHKISLILNLLLDEIDNPRTMVPDVRDVKIYIYMIKSMIRDGRSDNALEIIEELEKKKNMENSNELYSLRVWALFENDEKDSFSERSIKAERMVSEMKQSNVPVDHNIYNALLEGYLLERNRLAETLKQ